MYIYLLRSLCGNWFTAYSFPAEMIFIKHTSTASVLDSHLRPETPSMDLIVMVKSSRV